MSLRGNVPKLGMIACLCHYLLLLLNKKVHENKFVANLKVIFVFQYQKYAVWRSRTAESTFDLVLICLD